MDVGRTRGEVELGAAELDERHEEAGGLRRRQHRQELLVRPHREATQVLDHNEVDQANEGAEHARLEARLAEEAALGELLVLRVWHHTQQNKT